MSRIAQLPLPSFYNPDNAARWEYNPNLDALAVAAFEWAEKYKVKPAATDKFNLHVLGIDFQKDFCFPDGTLYVAGLSGTGGIDDSKRFSEFIYRYLSVITNITTTFDTHFALQIFFPYFWLGDDDKPLRPHTVIVFDTVNGRRKLVNKGLDGTVLNRNVRPNSALASWMSGGNYMWLTKQVEHYVEELEKAGKYQLYLWPPHCIFGGAGHALVGVIHEARMFQSYARIIQNHPKIKGTNPLTEHYGALEAEVLSRWDGKALDQIDTEFLNILFEADALVIAGQADSHCVKSTIYQLLDKIAVKDPQLAKKVYILVDCMSSVVVRDPNGNIVADFTPQAEEAHKKFAAAGMHLVKSTDSIETWPDLKIS